MADKAYDYDLIVIGGGSGGLRAAKTAAKLGAKVALCDYVVPSPPGTSWGLGGTCVNVGCVPKKLFHFSAQLGESMEMLETAGWKVAKNGDEQHDWHMTVDTVGHHIRQLRWNSRLVLTQLGVKYYNMLAKFCDANTLELHDPKKDKKDKITGKYILIAVGGRPDYPDAKEFPKAKELCITSDDIFYWKKFPGKSLVIGGSYVALETAGFLNSFGCDVTVLVRSKVLRNYDQDMAKRVTEFMKFKGVKFEFKATMEKLEGTKDGKKQVTYKFESGEKKTDEFDTVFVAIGRKAETSHLDLDAAGVKYDEKNKKVITNDDDQTNIPNIFSVGDCAYGRPELTPPAVHAGQLLAERLFGGSKEQMNYKMIATTFFTPLEYGCIGYSEDKAKEEFGDDKVSAYQSTFKPLEWVYNEELPGKICFLKMVCRKDENEKVIGLHYLGPNAGEIMQGFSLGINMGATKKDFQRTIGIHPTCAEEVLTINTPTDQKENSEGEEGCKGCGL